MSRLATLARVPSGRRAKWIVLLVWIAVVVVAGPLAGKLQDAEQNDAATWLPGKAESTQVLNLQERLGDDESVPAVIVYERPAGITPADQAKVAADVRAYAEVDGVAGEVVGPIPAGDRKALQAIVPVAVPEDEGWAGIAETVTKLRDIAGTGDGSSGLRAFVTGPAGRAADDSEAFSGIDGKLLVAALAVVILMLLLTYRSPVLWLLPVISGLVALLSAQAVVYLLAEYGGLTVNAQSAGILLVLVFGAGTDYALLLVARYREELRRHADRHEAMMVALRRASPAIVASAATVAAGMLCLMFAVTNSTFGLGPVTAIGVAVGLLVMITLLPALLVIFGRWVFWPFRPAYGSAEPTERGLWARWGRGIARRPRLIWVVTAVVLGALALGTLQLEASGLPRSETQTATTESVAGEEALGRHFTAGTGDPLVVIGAAAAADRLRAVVAATPGVEQTTPAAVRGGYAYLRATLADPTDSPAAQATVDRVRAAVREVPGGQAKVGGGAAIDLDGQRAAQRDREVIIPIVLMVVFLILVLLLRAILAPLLLMATVVLSFAAALGLSALAFEYVFGFSGADSSYPLYVFVFLVALGIDYNIFLMSRVREEATRLGTRRGALTGLAATGGVITSAGLVLAGTFAALTTLPLVAFIQIGFAVAIGVLLDTIIVRGVLVTALNLDVGRHIWWPGRLMRKRDVEVDQAAGDQVLVR